MLSLALLHPNTLTVYICTVLLGLSVRPQTVACSEFKHTQEPWFPLWVFNLLGSLHQSHTVWCLIHVRYYQISAAFFVLFNAYVNRYRHDCLSFVATGREAVIMMKLILAVLLVILAVGKSVSNFNLCLLEFIHCFP